MGKGIAGKNSVLYETGTSTAATDEACTEVSGTVFQVTDSAKRIADDEVAVVVKANTVVQSGNYTFDYNTVTVTFTDGSHTGESVTVTYNYLPRHKVAKVRLVNVQCAWDLGDSTCMEDDAEDNTPTILRITGDVETVQLLDEDLYGTTSLDDVFFAGSRKVLEYQPSGASAKVLRVRIIHDSASIANNGPSGLSAGRLTIRGDVGSGTFVSWATV